MACSFLTPIFTTLINSRVIKNQLILSMENYFLPMVSAYRKSYYSTQRVITAQVEEWKEHLYDNFVVGAV